MNVAEIGKKAGEMWKSLSADKKKVYEDRAAKAKTEYAAYIAKVKDTEGFKAFKDELAVARKKKLKRSVKSAMRKVPMDSSLKRPLSGYMLWFKDTRKSIKGKNVAEVSKKAGEMWKGLAADKKKVFADRALEAKKKYAAYVATGKGAAALKAYKEGIAKAKAPLLAKDDKAKAKKAAKKATAKKAAKAKKAAAAKAKKAAKAAAKKAAKAKKAAAKKAKKSTKKKPSKKAKALKKKAKKPVKKAKKLFAFIPDSISISAVTLLGSGVAAFAVLRFRRGVSNPSEKALL